MAHSPLTRQDNRITYGYAERSRRKQAPMPTENYDLFYFEGQMRRVLHIEQAQNSHGQIVLEM